MKILLPCLARLKSWVESLSEEYKIEAEDILFPAFISLYKKLNSSGNASGAKAFYNRHQSVFFKIPEFRKMAARFCSEHSRYIQSIYIHMLFVLLLQSRRVF